LVAYAEQLVRRRLGDDPDQPPPPPPPVAPFREVEPGVEAPPIQLPPGGIGGALRGEG
jgi:hypothetical protein